MYYLFFYTMFVPIIKIVYLDKFQFVVFTKCLLGFCTLFVINYR